MGILDDLMNQQMQAVIPPAPGNADINGTATPSYPPSPDQAGGQSPLPSGLLPQSQPAGGPVKRGLSKGVLGLLANFASGASEAGQAYSGVTENQLKKAQIPLHQAQTVLTQAEAQNQLLSYQMQLRRMQAMQDMAKGDPFSSLGELSPDENALKSVALQEATMKGDPEAIHQAIKQIVQQRAIFGRGQLTKTTITPDMVQTYPQLAPFVGKMMSVADMNGMIRGEGISNQVVSGAGGPVVVPKAGPNKGKATAVTLDGQRVGNPGVEVAEARARAGAKYGIAITTEGDTVSRLDALNQGIKLASGNPLIAKGLAPYMDAYAADARLKQMQMQANDQTGASDMALLFNHMAMTGGNVKGMRMGELMTQEHMKARSIPEDIGVLYNHAVQGQKLSPDQRKNFVNLAQEVRNTTWQRAAQEGKVYGVNPSVAEPDPDLPAVDLSNYTPRIPAVIKRGMKAAGGGNTGGGSKAGGFWDNKPVVK